MDRVLELVGQRPSKTEWENAEPKYSYGGICRRFGGWLAAWEAFVEYNSGRVKLREAVDVRPGRLSPKKRDVKPPPRSREVPLKLRLNVLKRDNYRCSLCGRSPAKDREAELHIDHVIPFSHGGKTVMDNLQTLSEKCNWGKGDSMGSLSLSGLSAVAQAVPDKTGKSCEDPNCVRRSE